MESIPDDSFVVFVRPARRPAELPQPPEEAVHICSTYEEAQQFRRDQQGHSQDCIIRFLGSVGGGD